VDVFGMYFVPNKAEIQLKFVAALYHIK
jgi:hypothetical protein